jgi:hypothetical protein
MASKTDRLFEAAAIVYRNGLKSTGTNLSECIGLLNGMACAIRILKGDNYPIAQQCNAWSKLLTAIFGADYGVGLPVIGEHYEWEHMEHAPKVITPSYCQDSAGNWFVMKYIADYDQD